MANQEQLDRLLKQGVQAWNKWRAENPDVQIDLTNVFFTEADLSRVNLSGADLFHANFFRANLRFADLSEANLSRVNLSGADLFHANFFRANLRFAKLREADLSEANLSFANLHAADLHAANLHAANLSSAHLSVADRFGVDLRVADVSTTSSRHYYHVVNLSRANLSEANLGHADLRAANLHAANLHAANLTGVDLNGAELRSADLSLARIRAADLSRAILSGANLGRADLSYTNLSKADLSGASFDLTSVESTTFGDVDLSVAKGLETVRHGGPSTIGIYAIYRSQGKIPEVFLKGAGVPDSFIEYMRSLVVSPIDYYSCFISYSSKDQAFAERLHADLQSKGIRCWFAPHDIKIGDKFRSRIDEAIRIYDKLLLVLSEHSIRSPWVEKEVEGAFEKERKQKKLMLFPVQLDGKIKRTRQAWAADIRRTRHIGDFTHWKDHDEYQKAFTRLLRDLQAS